MQIVYPPTNTTSQVHQRKTVTFSIPLSDIVDVPTSASTSAIASVQFLKSKSASRVQQQEMGYDGTTFASNSRSTNSGTTPKPTVPPPPRSPQRKVIETAPLPLSSPIHVPGRVTGWQPPAIKQYSGPLQSRSNNASAPKTRLPWLDGSRSRQSSMPIVPGAFLEDCPSRSKTSLKHVRDTEPFPVLTVSNELAESFITTEYRDKHVTNASRPLYRRHCSNASTSSSDTLRPGPQLAILQEGQLSRGIPRISAQDIATRATMEAPVDNLFSQPAMPLIALARALHVTDSTIASDTEQTVIERPRRSLSESSISVSPTSRSHIQLIRSEENLTNLEKLPPLADSSHRRISVSVQSRVNVPEPLRDNLIPPGTSVRKPSLAVQPIRTGKIRILSEEQPPQTLADREVSFAVQPVRAKTWKHLPPTAEAPSARELEPVQPSSNPEGPLPTAQSLRDAVAGLENLMQEAFRLARDAADHARHDDIPTLFEEAKLALLRASDVQNNQNVAMRHSPIRCSVSSPSFPSMSPKYTLNEQSANFPVASPDSIPCRTVDGQDGAINLSSSPMGRSHATVVPAAQTQAGVRTIWDEDWPHHRLSDPGDHHGDELGNPPSPGSQTRVPEVTSVDWAYASGSRPVGNQPPSSGFTGQVGHVRPQRNVNMSLKSQPSEMPLRKPVSTIISALPARSEVQAHIQEHGEPPQFPRHSSLSRQQRSILEEAFSTDHVLDVPVSPTHVSSGQVLSQRPITTQNWGRDKYDENDFINDDDILKGKNHVTLKDGQEFSLNNFHRRQPIARNWSTLRKRFTATVACLNTALIGVLIGTYAGEVPAIQYALADQHHRVILGNVALYLAMGTIVLLFWPLPLLHGRKPYTLVALGFALPLQIPQALVVATSQSNNYSRYTFGLLFSRALSGLALGFAHINLMSTLLDLFGASLQSEYPHGELVVVNDIRRHGGGMGLWLGIWSCCWIGSLAIGFLIGANVISGLNASWGFYINIILIAAALLLNVITPETRRSPHRRTVQEIQLPNDSVSRRMARGEIKMHVSGEGPKWWWEEVFAGIYLSYRMLAQTGFLVMAFYLAWIYAQVVLIIVLLGNLLSAEYRWRPEYVGLGVFAVAVGALLAVPSSKANILSLSRIRGPRTDSMTMQPRIMWSSHLIRRALFMIALPIAGLAYTLASRGSSIQYMVPIIFAALIGYVSNLAISECNGILMETFDTCDLQPGANSRHRLQSLPPGTKEKRTAYSSYPRVSAGFFVSQGLGFLLAAAATGVGGAVTRKVGAQKATAITAGVLLGLTLLLTAALWRFKEVQVVPNELFGHSFGSTATAANAQQRRNSSASMQSDKSWRAVIIGNPSGKTRRMSWLELGSLSRWTEIRRLNRLLSRSTTQPLNPGWQ